VYEERTPRDGPEIKQSEGGARTELDIWAREVVIESDWTPGGRGDRQMIIVYWNICDVKRNQVKPSRWVRQAVLYKIKTFCVAE
jgi:hypothetical protein